MYQLRDYQQDLINQIFAAWAEGNRRVMAQLSTGGGKCLGKDTPVLMYDGTIKAVQDIKQGDLLMGDDNKPRKVLSLCRGREEMFEIAPVKGETWTCNRSHILSLVYNGETRKKKNLINGQVYDISVDEYLNLTKTEKHCLKLYRVDVDYPEQAVSLDPYILGVWLGDGTEGKRNDLGQWSRASAIATIKPEIITEIDKWATANDAKTRTEPRESKHNSQSIFILGLHSNGCKGGSNPFLNALDFYNLRGNKHIPLSYLANNRQTRLELLAGLIDTDGYVYRSGVEIVQKRPILTQQIAQLCRSLGYRALISQKVVKEETYYRISITGDLSEVPTRVGYKQIPPRLQKKDALRSGFAVKSLGEGDYYGFEIDGNRRFLLGDFTVTHNTVIFAHIARNFLEQGEGVLVVAHRQELILQAKEKLEAIAGLECGIIKAGYPAEYHKDIQVASIQSLSRRKIRPDIGLLIIDEAHHASSKSYTDLIERYPNAYILGVTATPCRTDGQGFRWLFDKLVAGISTRELIDLGHLCKFRLYGAKAISTGGVSKSGGDYNQAQLEDRAMALIGDVTPVWEKYAKGKQTIVFAVSVAHSKEIVKLFCESGYKAEHIDGTTPDCDRAHIIERFKNRETTILSNVGIFTEGFDVPGIEAVQCVRPTMSLSLWLQMVGRGLRPSSGKEHCTIIDHSDNWHSHGLPDEPRGWTLDPVPLRPTKYTQQCPNCSHVFTPLSHEQTKPIQKFLDAKGAIRSLHWSCCPSCRFGFEWEQGTGGEGGSRIAKRDHGEIIAIDLDCTQEGLDAIRAAVEMQQSTGKKPGWVYFHLMKQEIAPQLSLGDWRYLAKHLGYKEGWAYKALQEARAVQLSLPV